MAPVHDFYVPTALEGDEYSVCTSTNSQVSSPGQNPGPGRIMDIILSRLGMKLDSLFAMVAHATGFGPHAMLLRLLNSMQPRTSLKVHSYGPRRPRSLRHRADCKSITMAFSHMACLLPMENIDGPILGTVCEQLVRSFQLVLPHCAIM